MNTSTPLALARCAAVTLPMLFAFPALAQTQSWDYKSYPRDKLSGQYLKDKFNLSTITLDEKDGKATFRMVTPGRGELCFSRGDLPAVVERSADTTIITVTPELAGCEPFRYVIRNDGSGGVRMVMRNERWVSDGLDHGLTRKP